MEKMSGAILYNLEFAKKNCKRCILNVSIVSGQKFFLKQITIYGIHHNLLVEDIIVS